MAGGGAMVGAGGRLVVVVDDGGPEGGRPGVPPPAEILRFMQVAKQYGAVSVSFWSWQHANAPAWDAIKNAPQFLAAPKR